MANGGKDEPVNFAITHEHCNKSKQDADLEVAKRLYALEKIINVAEQSHETPSLKHVLLANGGSKYLFKYKIEENQIVYSFDDNGDTVIRKSEVFTEEILIGKYDTEIGTYRIENNISDGRDSSITDDHLIAYRLCKEEIMYNWVQYLRLLIKNHFAFAGTMYNEDNLFQQRIPDQLWENIRTFIINLKNLPVWKDRSMAATIFGGKNKYDFWKIIFQTGKTSDGTQVLVVPLNVADMIKK